MRVRQPAIANERLYFSLLLPVCPECRFLWLALVRAAEIMRYGAIIYYDKHVDNHQGNSGGDAHLEVVL